MQTRYIQAAVSAKDHRDFTIFSVTHGVSLGDLIATAVREYIKIQTDKEEWEAKKKESEEEPEKA